jgi:hypothetical protein
MKDDVVTDSGYRILLGARSYADSFTLAATPHEDWLDQCVKAKWRISVYVCSRVDVLVPRHTQRLE